MRVVDAHFASLSRLVDDGVVLMAGRTVDTGERTFGIVVFVAPSQAAAEDVMRGELFPVSRRAVVVAVACADGLRRLRSPRPPRSRDGFRAG